MLAQHRFARANAVLGRRNKLTATYKGRRDSVGPPYILSGAVKGREVIRARHQPPPSFAHA